MARVGGAINSTLAHVLPQGLGVALVLQARRILHTEEMMLSQCEPTSLRVRIQRSWFAPVILAVFGFLLLSLACGSEADKQTADFPVSVTIRTATATLAPPIDAVTATPTSTLDATPPTGPVDVPILMYHHVTPVPPSDQLGFSLTVTTDDFARQLDYLECAGYTTFTLDELFDHMYHGGALPEKPIVLTFDDGYADAFTDVLPLLNDKGFRGTFAVVTGFLGSEGYLTSTQIESMAADGMEFVAHTTTHIDLNTSSDDTVRDQLGESKRVLEELTNRAVSFFVYPSGEPFRSGSEDRQGTVVAMLRDAGYSGALLAGPSSTSQNPGQPYALNRVRISGGDGLLTFAYSIVGSGDVVVATACTP